MRAERLDSSPPLGHSAPGWMPPGELAARSMGRLRSRAWYGEVASAFAMIIRLALLLATAALSGLVLGIVL